MALMLWPGSNGTGEEDLEKATCLHLLPGISDFLLGILISNSRQACLWSRGQATSRKNGPQDEGKGFKSDLS